MNLGIWEVHSIKITLKPVWNVFTYSFWACHADTSTLNLDFYLWTQFSPCNLNEAFLCGISWHPENKEFQELVFCMVMHSFVYFLIIACVINAQHAINYAYHLMDIEFSCGKQLESQPCTSQACQITHPLGAILQSASYLPCAKFYKIQLTRDWFRIWRREAEWSRRWSDSEARRALREVSPTVRMAWAMLDVTKRNRSATLIAT